MKFEGIFQIFRGIVDFVINAKHAIQIVPTGTTRSRIPFPPFILAETNDRKEILEMVTIGKNIKAKYNLSKDQVSELASLFKRLSETPSQETTRSLFANCFRNYADAMDGILKHEVFLGFWQLAENITMAEKIGGKTEIVNSRIKWHIKKTELLGKSMDETVKSLSIARNNIVHRGIREVDDDDLVIIKFLCESALIWLTHVENKLKTQRQLEFFYSFKDMNNSALEDKIEETAEAMSVLKIIKRNRNKK